MNGDKSKRKVFTPRVLLVWQLRVLLVWQLRVLLVWQLRVLLVWQLRVLQCGAESCGTSKGMAAADTHFICSSLEPGFFKEGQKGEIRLS
uniref:Secreted protein n=1 Tax=Knipowitschia caucasica TaxID=637954 RepID=A0AAV2J782_KNICA